MHLKYMYKLCINWAKIGININKTRENKEIRKSKKIEKKIMNQRQFFFISLKIICIKIDKIKVYLTPMYDTV